MRKKGLSQEALKGIACFTMLLDHIGATMVQGYALRIIGRIAFPIFCFLMAEGTFYTKNPRKYGLRLMIGALLSEIPFDLAFRGKLTWEYQNVMLTLFLGFLTVEIIQRTEFDIVKVLAVSGGFALAEWANTDYGGFGVLLVVLFSQTRGKLWFQTIMVAMFSWMINSLKIPVLGILVPIEMFAIFAMIPIALYSGGKVTSNRAVQWGFYLFYPVHLIILVLVRILLWNQPVLETLTRMLRLH